MAKKIVQSKPATEVEVQVDDNNTTPEVIEDKPKATANDFFTAKDASGDINSFIKDMKIKREEVEPPPAFEEPEEAEVEPEDPEAGLPGESDEQMAEHLDFTEEHRFTAEFILIQMDKMLAFSFGLISGMDGDRYRRRKEKIQGNDYEAELGAALIKKYQLRLGLEWMFISAIVIGYAPMMNKAMKDRKEVVKEKQRIQPIKS